jgi:transposase
MIAVENTTEPTMKFTVPWDITEWRDKQSLLAGVVEDIDSLDWTNADLVAFLAANPRYQPRFLFILLTYAYTMGVCDSQEVCDLYYRDTALTNSFAGQSPSPSVVTRFRRENRGLLKWSVAQAFKRALRARFEIGEGQIPAGLSRCLSEAASIRLDVGRHLDRSAQGE